MTRTEIIARLEKVTGLALSAISGHKLCDFRPFFGLAFADLLAGAEFWGFCDPDIMLGDVDRLLTPAFLGSIDVFTAHDTQCAGHFTVLRKVKAIDEAAFRMRGWRELCAEPFTRLVEERLLPEALATDSSLRISRPLPLQEELQRPFARVGITFDFQGRVAYLEQPETPLVEWRGGCVYYRLSDGATVEALYVHFMGLKRWWHWLAYNEKSDRQPEHRFSRVGYGYASRPEQLLRFPWTMWYVVQRFLVEGKAIGGRLIRRLVPAGVFLKLRRQIFGRGR